MSESSSETRAKAPVAPGYRAGILGVVGKPNAGKSSLLNSWLGEPVAIVSSKPQTTRGRAVGLISLPEGQIVIEDSPGVVPGKMRERPLNAFLESEFASILKNSDALMVVLPLDEEKPAEIESILDQVVASGKPWMAVVHKVDLKKLRSRIDKIRTMITLRNPKVFVVEASSREPWSALLRQSIENVVLPMLPLSPGGPLYDPEFYTSHPVRDLVCEKIREACFHVLHDEVPYQLAVRVRSLDETKANNTTIHAEILVARRGQVKILVGEGGAGIKGIGEAARKSITQMIGGKVHLFLEVNLRERWFENARLMQELGYSDGKSKAPTKTQKVGPKKSAEKRRNSK